MKKIIAMLSIVLVAAGCGPKNTCTCKSCLDPTDTTQCCPSDDNTGGGCFGDPDMPIPAGKDIMPDANIPMVPLPLGHNPEDIAPIFEEHEEIIPDDELPQE
jgi:hypothetical protein